MTKNLLVTGSSDLIGSEVCVYFSQLGYTIHGVDNNQRAVFFGPRRQLNLRSGFHSEEK